MSPNVGRKLKRCQKGDLEFYNFPDPKESRFRNLRLEIHNVAVDKDR